MEKLHFLKFLWEQTTIDETNSSYLSLDGSTYNEINLSKEWSIWLWHLKCNFQQYFSYILAVSCNGGGNWSPIENHIGLSQVTDKLDHIILYRIHFAATVSFNRTHNSLIAQIQLPYDHDYDSPFQEVKSKRSPDIVNSITGLKSKFVEIYDLLNVTKCLTKSYQYS